MVPNYLVSIADRIKEKKNLTAFHLKCLCGNNTFLLAKSKNEEDKGNSFDKYWDSFRLPIFSLETAIDKNGERYVYGTTFFGIRIGKFYIKDLPKFNMRRIIKATCNQCGTQFIVFDSQYHGYNALTENEQQVVSEFASQFIYTKNPKEVFIELRTDLSYDEFSDEFGENMEKYSNAFGNIEIYILTKGRKKKFFEEETS